MGWCLGIITVEFQADMCPPQRPFGSTIASPTQLGTFSWTSTVSLGSLEPALAGAVPKMLESDGNIAACVVLPTGWELSAFRGLAALSASPCPVSPRTVCPPGTGV